MRRTANEQTAALAGLLQDLAYVRDLAPEDPERVEWVHLKEGLVAALEAEFPSD